jgi:hypothetical protein|tara:strand:- start:138 stop:497 length:360 start_codon:yes stop_codon:yes gene_type:complete
MTDDLLSFFYHPENAPHNGVDTSIDAAESISESLSAMRLQVFKEVKNSKDGLTCDEVEQILDMKHQTASARLNDLMKSEPPVLCFEIDGKTNKPRRRTTRSGRTARIYFAISSKCPAQT